MFAPVIHIERVRYGVSVYFMVRSAEGMRRQRESKIIGKDESSSIYAANRSSVLFAASYLIHFFPTSYISLICIVEIVPQLGKLS